MTIYELCLALMHHFFGSFNLFFCFKYSYNLTFVVGVRTKNVSEKSSPKNTTFGELENIPMDTLEHAAKNNNAENEEKSITEPHSQEKTLVQNQFSRKTNEIHDEDIPTNGDDKIDFEKYAILKIKDAVNELLKETDLRPRITFLDFSGQSMYYAFHQIFLRPKSCSILVVDMTKSLDEKVDVEDNNEEKCSQFGSWRYRGNELNKPWLSYAASGLDMDMHVCDIILYCIFCRLLQILVEVDRQF